MLKIFLINVRDSCYILLVTRNGQKYAEKEHGYFFMLMLGVCYVVLLTLLAVLQFKAGIRVPEMFRQNIFAVLLGGLIIFSPYYFIIKSILKKLSPVPVETHVTPEKVKKVWLFFMDVYWYLFYVISEGTGNKCFQYPLKQRRAYPDVQGRFRVVGLRVEEMNRFWQSLITIRDFGYQWTVFSMDHNPKFRTPDLVLN